MDTQIIAETKALKLIVRYSQLEGLMREHTEAIGQQYYNCISAQVGPRSMWEGEVTTHLSKWYGKTIERGVPVNSEEVCSHCHQAHQTVLARKKLRRQLGGVKGAMFKLGKEFDV